MSNIATLTYDAATSLLYGAIPGFKSFHMFAESGGGRGRTEGAAQNDIYSHLATTRTVKTVKHNYIQRGGTLPPGDYKCTYWANHKTFKECVQLITQENAKRIFSPFAIHAIVHCRKLDDFFIHGRGKLGSDGCIVPYNRAERLRLARAIRDYDGDVIITVKHVGYMLPAENVNGLVT